MIVVMTGAEALKFRVLITELQRTCEYLSVLGRVFFKTQATLLSGYPSYSLVVSARTISVKIRNCGFSNVVYSRVFFFSFIPNRL